MVKQRAGGDEKLGLQPRTRIRLMVATATIEATNMEVVCKDIWPIILELESLVNSDLQSV